MSFTFNKNNLSNIARFSRDMMQHFIYFVTSDTQTHTFNIDDYNESANSYDFLSNRVYKDDSNLDIEYDMININNFDTSDTIDIVSIDSLSSNVRYYEGNKKYNIVLTVESYNTFIIDKLYYVNESETYLKCVSNSENNNWLFDVVGYNSETKVNDIVNGNYDYSTITDIIDLESAETIHTYNNLDVLKIKDYVSVLNVSDYIRIFNTNDDLAFEAKIIKSTIIGDDLLIQLDRYIEDVVSTYTMKTYEFVSLSSPKLVSKNYITLPTMNYLNRFINDNSRVIDLIGQNLMLTPGAIKTLFEGNENEATEILIRNDKYENIYTNGDAIADGFYVISMKYDKVVSTNDIQYKIRIKLNDDVVPGFQKIGGVIIENKIVKSYFADIEDKNSELDIYKIYKQNVGQIVNGIVYNDVNVLKDDTMENVKSKINAQMSNLRNYSRNDITTILDNDDTNINNIIYNIFTYNNNVNFDVMVVDDGVYEYVRVDIDSLSLYTKFNLIYKIH